jgi:predicted nucleic acid-binding protein
VSGALLDTSVVMGSFESLQVEMPATMAISVITLGELRAGVRLAHDATVRAARQARFNAVRDTFEPIPVDEAVAEHYGDILAAARSAGRSSTATDLLIIATAASAGRVLHTLDKRQAALAHVAGVPIQTSP